MAREAPENDPMAGDQDLFVVHLQAQDTSQAPASTLRALYDGNVHAVPHQRIHAFDLG